jgi:ribosomal protein S27AE
MTRDSAGLLRRARRAGSLGDGPLPAMQSPRSGDVNRPVSGLFIGFIRYNWRMVRKCSNCGESLLLARSDARFCSTKCRVASHREANSSPIPVSLRNRNRWVRWKTVTRGGKPTKLPLQVDGSIASSTDESTWSAYRATTQASVGDGIGFVVGDGIGCIDLDHCLNNGVPSLAAADFITLYPHNYIEVSPSGDGLHIWGTADPQPGRRLAIDGLSVEWYSRERYITVTGRVFQQGTLRPLHAL